MATARQQPPQPFPLLFQQLRARHIQPQKRKCSTPAQEPLSLSSTRLQLLLSEHLQTQAPQLCSHCSRHFGEDSVLSFCRGDTSGYALSQQAPSAAAADPEWSTQHHRKVKSLSAEQCRIPPRCQQGMAYPYPSTWSSFRHSPSPSVPPH